jgi:HAD superfamily hydrolase (TIGR01509 family)
LVQQHGWDLDIERLVKRKFELLDEIFETDPFPGVPEFLAYWRGRTRFAVASNSPESFVRGVLCDLGVWEDVEVLCTVNDVKRRKPDPEMLHLVLSRMGLTAGDVLVFEDSEPGIQAAVAAHCPVVVMDTPAAIQAGPPPPGLATATWPELVAASMEPVGAGGKPC